MQELTVETMFTTKSYEVCETFCTDGVKVTDRKRMLEHLVCTAANKALNMPGANPVGLAITVHYQLNEETSKPELVVKATIPKYEFEEEFFSA